MSNRLNWKPEGKVEVLIPRHSWLTFWPRLGEAMLLARQFRVIDEVGGSRVEFIPHSPELVNALYKIIEPGETIYYGSRSLSKEVCTIVDAS